MKTKYLCHLFERTILGSLQIAFIDVHCVCGDSLLSRGIVFVGDGLVKSKNVRD